MSVLNPRDVSNKMWVGSVASAVLTKKGNIYKGICREFMMHLGGDVENIEILLDKEGRTTRLIDLMPEYPRHK